ncbi:MAG TPA: tyrosine recombinase XerS, partial [Niallia sp.]|nr:tyrosine recombinase XerS [Niallia sp.]
ILIRNKELETPDFTSIPYEVLEKLEKKLVDSYIGFLKNENISTKKDKGNVEHRGPAVVELSIHALKSLFNYLTTETEKEDGECYFDRNVMSKIVLHKKRETANRRARKISSVILNEDEINEYLHFIEHEYVNTLENQNQIRSYERNALRDLTINSLILGTGMRVGEIASIEVKNINLRKRTIEITRKGGVEDTVLVMGSSIETLERYLKDRLVKFPKAVDSPFLFVTNYGGGVTPLTRRAIQNIVNKYTAAFSKSAGMSPHKLRHSFAVDFIRNNGDIVLLRDQLGHNDIKTTSLYTNMADTDSLRILDKMDENRQH